MEIESSSSRFLVRSPESRSVRRSAAASTDAGAFPEADALRAALERTPEVRTEAVERGRALVSSINYPPPETLDRLARLFALGLGDDSAPAGSRIR